jgi:hypothetical protein
VIPEKRGYTTKGEARKLRNSPNKQSPKKEINQPEIVIDL